MKRLASFVVDADLLRQPERREPIDDAEVDRLGAAAMLGVDLVGGTPKTCEAVRV